MSDARTAPDAEPASVATGPGARSSVLALMTWLQRPLAVALVVWAVYFAFVVALLRGGHDPRDFIDQGRLFVTKAHSSQAIHIDPTYHGYDYIGYDGQFFYYIALDPVGARPYIDTPSYRYPRIVYPLVARALALGRAALIPYMLILINLVAAGLGVLALAAWLRRRGLSPWYALVYGFFPGVGIALRYDLSEPLAYALAAIGVLVFDSPRRRDRLLAAAIFAVAVLTRETAAVFPFVFFLMELWRGNGPSLLRRAVRNAPWAIGFGVLAIGPYIAWKAFLYVWLGGLGAGLNELFDTLPFLGIGYWLAHPTARLGPAENLRTVVVPSTIVFVLVLYAFYRRGRFPMGWLYIVNYVPFVVFLTRNSYVDELAGPRIICGVVMAGILCLPELLPLGARVRGWFWASSALWLSSAPFLLLPPFLEYLDQILRHRLLHRA